MGNSSGAKTTNNVEKTIELPRTFESSNKRGNVKVTFTDDIFRGNISFQFESKIVRIYVCSSCLGIYFYYTLFLS
jgi:hypothetical protein